MLARTFSSRNASGVLVDALVPGARLSDAPSAAAAPASRAVSRARDLALTVGGLALVFFCLWLDARSLAHQTTLVAGALALDARSVTGDALLLLASVGLLVLSARFEARALLRETALILGGTLLLALTAQVKIYLPGNLVPVTGQTFGVLLLAAALGWRRGLTAVALYVTLGTAGLPVFADVSNAATYGYLAGFALAALVVGWLAEHGWDRNFLTCIVAMLLGEVAIFASGLVGLAPYTGWDHALVYGLYPFLVGDALKTLAAALLLPALWFVTRQARRR